MATIGASFWGHDIHTWDDIVAIKMLGPDTIAPSMGEVILDYHLRILTDPTHCHGNPLISKETPNDGTKGDNMNSTLDFLSLIKHTADTTTCDELDAKILSFGNKGTPFLKEYHEFLADAFQGDEHHESGLATYQIPNPTKDVLVAANDLILLVFGCGLWENEIEGVEYKGYHFARWAATNNANLRKNDPARKPRPPAPELLVAELNRICMFAKFEDGVPRQPVSYWDATKECPHCKKLSADGAYCGGVRVAHTVGIVVCAQFGRK